MKFQLNGSEMADWQECWCFRCAHDHLFSHAPHDMEDDGCPLILRAGCGEDVAQFEPHGDDWYRTIPAGVVCREFVPCTATECNDHGDEERRGCETWREFHDRLRAETIALPRVDLAHQGNNPHEAAML